MHQVTAFQASDGTLYGSSVAAARHDAREKLTAVLMNCRLTYAEGQVYELASAILDNAEGIVTVLTNYERERPKAEKANA